MGEVSYRPLIEDMTWSFSRVSCFESCRYKWFMSYVRGWSGEETFYASYGSLIHKIIQLYYTGKLEKKNMPVYFLQHFRTDVKGERPKECTVTKYINEGLNYCRDFEPFPFDPVDVEKKIEFDIYGIPFVCFIDFVGVKDGELYIVDHKSRDLKQRSSRKKPTINDMEIDSMLRQLYVYSEAVYKEYGKYPAELCFNCFKNGQFIREKFNESTLIETKKWVVDSVHRIEDEEEFDPDIEMFKCKWLCGLNNRCIYNIEEQKEWRLSKLHEG